MRIPLVPAHLAGRGHGRWIEAVRHRAPRDQRPHQTLLASRQRVVLGHLHTFRAPAVIGAAPAAAAI
ncbi:MAG TPA: hypothetical protein VFL67_05420, partial [Mycobacterium sp.]|nr:hypothetical protein [Mycobacterium sp.]